MVRLSVFLRILTYPLFVINYILISIVALLYFLITEPLEIKEHLKICKLVFAKYTQRIFREFWTGVKE